MASDRLGAGSAILFADLSLRVVPQCLTGARVMGCSPPPRVPGTLIAVHVSPVFAAATAPGTGEIQDFLVVTQSDEKSAPTARRTDTPEPRADNGSPERPSPARAPASRVVTSNGLCVGVITGQRPSVPGGSRCGSPVWVGSACSCQREDSGYPESGRFQHRNAGACRRSRRHHVIQQDNRGFRWWQTFRDESDTAGEIRVSRRRVERRRIANASRERQRRRRGKAGRTCHSQYVGTAAGPGGRRTGGRGHEPRIGPHAGQPGHRGGDQRAEHGRQLATPALLEREHQLTRRSPVRGQREHRRPDTGDAHRRAEQGQAAGARTRTPGAAAGTTGREQQVDQHGSDDAGAHRQPDPLRRGARRSRSGEDGACADDPTNRPTDRSADHRPQPG